MFRIMRKWWPKRDGQPLIGINVGYWRELGKWPVPGRIFRWSGYLPHVWYFLACAIWRRYDRLEIPTLPPTWNEWDEKLLHAAFAVLTDYIQHSGSSRWTVELLQREIAALPADHDDDHSRRWCESYLPTAMELETLYHWWTVERDHDLRVHDDALMTWHERYETVGGIHSEATNNPCLNRLVFPVDAEADRLAVIHRDLKAQNTAKDEEMLVRLMRVRHTLWS